MGKSTVDRELKVLHRVGLMPKVSDDPPLFYLADLRKLAKLGAAELRRRLVPQGDNEDEGGGNEPPPEGGAGWPQSGPGGGDAQPNGSTPQQMGAEAPAGSGGGLVPQGDKGADLAPVGEILRKTTLADLVLSQKQGGLVPQKGVFVPETGGFCPTKAAPLILNLSIQKETTTPPSPASGGRDISQIATGEEATGNGESQSKNFPDEGQEQDGAERALTPAAKLLGQLVWASAQVMRAHNLTPDRRAEEAICEAFELWCSKTGRTVAEAVALEAENFRAYQEQSHLMTYNWGFRWWFKRGYWAKPGLWPYDRQKLAQMQHASIGKYTPAEGGP
jgi:hypothetical protein